MDPPEKLEQSEICKNKGTDYFKVAQKTCSVSVKYKLTISADFNKNW